jgi:hypothetical protein
MVIMSKIMVESEAMVIYYSAHILSMSKGGEN